MELIPRKATIEITNDQAVLIEQMCGNAWKAGWVKDPVDGASLESLRAEVRKAFAVPLEVKK